MKTKRIELGVYGIVVTLTGVPGSGTITSDLNKRDAAMDAVECMVLAHACEGIDVKAAAYLEGLETAIEAVGNHE